MDEGRFHADGADLESRAAYLRGLVEGLDLSAASREGLILAEVVDLLGEMAREVGNLHRAEPRAALDHLTPENSVVVDSGAEDSDPFLACECPNCGASVFTRLDRAAGPDESRVTCDQCGRAFSVRERPPAAGWTPGLASHLGVGDPGAGDGPFRRVSPRPTAHRFGRRGTGPRRPKGPRV